MITNIDIVIFNLKLIIWFIDFMYTAEFIVHLISYLLLRIAVNTILRLRLGDCYPKSPDRTRSHTHLETETLVHDNLTTTSRGKKL